jgi:hypothetical protein
MLVGLGFWAAAFAFGTAGRLYGLAVCAVVGLSVALFGSLFSIALKKREWVIVNADCLDREIGQEWHSHGQTWCFRTVCQFTLECKQYTVTPDYSGIVASRQGAERFLGRAISPAGKCLLYVNPADPLEAEIAGPSLMSSLTRACMRDKVIRNK